MTVSNAEPEGLFEGFWALSIAEREARWFERAEALETPETRPLLILRLREMHRAAVVRRSGPQM